MKYFIIVCGILSFYCIRGKAQPVTNDTVVCIVDTTKSYVQYWDNPIQRDEYQFPPHWQVGIEGSYYDGKSYEDVAVIVFRAGLWGGVDVDGRFPQKKLPKEQIAERFSLFYDKWIHNEKNLDTLGKKIGYAPFSKYNYIIYSQDYNCEDSDTVTMHRVEILYGEVWF